MIEIDFECQGFNLKGFLHLPENTRPAVVIGSHGLMADADSPKQTALASALTRKGIAFFRFHHRGCGPDRENFATATSFAGRVADLTAAADLMRSRPDLNGKIGLFGSSLGGAVCLSAWPRVNPEAVVVFAAPATSDFQHPPDTPSPLPKEFQDFRRLDFSLPKHIGKVSHILIIHGDVDPVVPPSHARIIHNAASEPKRLMLFQNGDHRMSDPKHQTRFVKEATSWFRTRLAPR